MKMWEIFVSKDLNVLLLLDLLLLWLPIFVCDFKNGNENSNLTLITHIKNQQSKFKI